MDLASLLFGDGAFSCGNIRGKTNKKPFVPLLHDLRSWGRRGVAVSGTTVAEVRFLVIMMEGGGVRAEVFFRVLSCLTLNFTLGG